MWLARREIDSMQPAKKGECFRFSIKPVDMSVPSLSDVRCSNFFGSDRIRSAPPPPTGSPPPLCVM